MNDNTLKAVIEIAQTVGIVVAAIGGIVTSVLAYLVKRDGNATRNSMGEVAKHTNSMKDELVAAVKEAATAIGKEAGRKEEVKDEAARKVEAKEEAKADKQTPEDKVNFT